jgi:hypothetical protein
MVQRVILILVGVLLAATLLLERPTPMAIAPREAQSTGGRAAPAG